MPGLTPNRICRIFIYRKTKFQTFGYTLNRTPPAPSTRLGSSINGAILPVLPGHVLLFPKPSCDLPPGGPGWLDDNHDPDEDELSAGLPRHRRRWFSAAFLAGLVRDLGAVCVVALDPVDYDPAPLAVAGLGLVTLDDLGVSSGAGGDCEGQDSEPRLSMQVQRSLASHPLF
jgi:hypothetical protein